jgi:hypothetical protein
MTSPTIESGIYRHFRGNLYFVQGVAIRNDDDTEDIVYHPLYPSQHKLFTQSRRKFTEPIQRESYSGPRFNKLRNWDLPIPMPLPGDIIGSSRALLGSYKVLSYFPKDDGRIEVQVFFSESKLVTIPIEDLIDDLRKRFGVFSLGEF